ncbi:cell division protein FtsQ [Pigmentiphaga aceris]|uniref:Cell division protein FtsQ n=1 Tax=Pigmentiphaga aceris TaxID=1940612 RepID=A0A5C0B132_9BURK|nr:cell division protein FtsQ [Pigmentiphaga aceris]QEI07413.1 cell division protein FtsQ [Pigmentiphaga aceris]
MTNFRSISRGFASLLLAMICLGASAQPTRLYRAGPTADASFLRFVDGTGGGVTATSAAGTVVLTAQQASTAFTPVASKWQVKGQVTKNGKQAHVAVDVQPGEFVTVVALPGSAEGLALQLLREQPDDFNAIKASLGFANLAEKECEAAGLKLAGRDTFLFEKADAKTFSRRLLNPVDVSVQLTCGGKPVGAALALGQLEAGERYSVLAIPDTKGPRLIFAHDSLTQ